MKKLTDTNRTLLYEELGKRKEFLENVIKITSERLRSAPKENIRTSYSKKLDRVQFYLREQANEKSGRYIRKSEWSIVPKLLQKKYDKKVLLLAKEEKDMIEQLIKLNNKENIESVYKDLYPEEKFMIRPVSVDDESYVNEWNAVAYVPKKFHEEDTTEYYTKKGERVRSKSEILIADSLYSAGIPYVYEFPVQLPNGVVLHPDFKVLNVRLRKTFYWEHLGMMDDRDYIRQNVEKINNYCNAGLTIGDNLILSMETTRNPLSSLYIRKIVNTVLT